MPRGFESHPVRQSEKHPVRDAFCFGEFMRIRSRSVVIANDRAARLRESNPTLSAKKRLVSASCFLYNIDALQSLCNGFQFENHQLFIYGSKLMALFYIFS